MGNPKGFLEVRRKAGGYRPVIERVGDFSEVELQLNENDRKSQASRCMDCGIPFCQWGCPIMNNMPEWQDAIYKGEWEKASDILHVTNNFPEFTGKICPAPCEHACVLNIHEEPVTIRENESSVAEKAFAMGYIKPNPPKKRTGKKVAVIGSGPAGLACADLLNKWGHTVTVFERDDAVGGLLRYGIPDFKLNKSVIDRRMAILIDEGLKIKTNVDVGVDITGDELLKKFDSVVLAIGAMKPRDLPVEGRDLKGIHFAMDFLTQQNRLVRGLDVAEVEKITAKDKNVVVIGGGDTGSDCVGTSVRHGASSITQIEILPKPPLKRSLNNPWPYWANTLRTSSSHEEGAERKWSLATKRFIGEKGHVKQMEVVEVSWEKKDGRMVMVEKPNSLKKMDADLVLLSMGFLHPIHEGLADGLKLEYDERGNIKVGEGMQTSNPKVFAAGDAVSGASLVVRAIASGRKTAEMVHEHLMA
ncbi:MAG: glutamate synthase subunit beta [Bacteroidota bacterium]